jgi:hypothetical protein
LHCGPDERQEGRVSGLRLQDQGAEGEAGAGNPQEGGSDGKGHPKDEPPLTLTVTKRLWRTSTKRTIGCTEDSHWKSSGRASRSSPRGSARTRGGTTWSSPGNPKSTTRQRRGRKSGRCRSDPLLRDGRDPGEAMFQVPSFRSHGEGV